MTNLRAARTTDDQPTDTRITGQPSVPPATGGRWTRAPWHADSPCWQPISSGTTTRSHAHRRLDAGIDGERRHAEAAVPDEPVLDVTATRAAHPVSYTNRKGVSLQQDQTLHVASH
jgi:hypothetical protein